MRGMEKIHVTCRQALNDGFRWVWIDTCCIDKSSSAELSEAINSMYNWYAKAAYCYVYLEDVKYDLEEWQRPDQSIVQIIQERSGQYHLSFTELVGLWRTQGIHGQLRAMTLIHESRWFTRGWTLQELLAPREVRFFSQSGAFLGTKRDLISTLAEKTGVPAQVLADPNLIHFCSISMRMTWMKDRQTTRQEDLAYCLLGLFDVNMPLLYGEGHKAFQRLQKAILEALDDETLLAWEGTDVGTMDGAFARSPSAFERSFTPSQMTSHTELPTLTSRGLTMKRNLYRRQRRKVTARKRYTTKLNCKDGQGHDLYLLLLPAPNSRATEEDEIFSRDGCRPISEQELQQDWIQLGTRDLTISRSHSTSSIRERDYLHFMLYQENYTTRLHHPLCRPTSKLMPDDPAHDITLSSQFGYVIDAFTRYPFFGLHSSLFRFRLDVGSYDTIELERIELVIEIDHTGRSSTYLSKQADQVQSTNEEQLQKYLQDIQEFILIQSGRSPVDRISFRNVMVSTNPSLQDSLIDGQNIKTPIDPSFAKKLPHDVQVARQLFERKDQIRSALADSAKRRNLSPASPELASASFIKLRDSWLVVAVHQHNALQGLAVNIWLLFSPSEGGSLITSGKFSI